METVAQVCREQGADEETATEIADAVVQEAACKLAAAGETEEEIEADLISSALYDLTEAEVSVLQQMEDQLIMRESALAEAAANAEDPADTEAALEEISTLDSFVENILAAQEALIEDYELDTAAEVLDQVAEEEPAADCEECQSRYVAAIENISSDMAEVEATTEAMARSLAEIDPNTENAGEGKALIRKMYQLKGVEPEAMVPVMPVTPDECVPRVAGKVLQLEQLEEDMTKALSFRDFFAEVYCMAYVNSLVTMKDGLSQIFPGGLDWQIEEELQRVYGPFEEDQMDMIEIAAVEAYMGALESGDFANDDSSLIAAVTPLEEALVLCDQAVVEEIEGAKQDREDYLYDFNFLRYLRTL